MKLWNAQHAAKRPLPGTQNPKTITTRIPVSIPDPKEQILFSIQLKIGQKIIDVEVLASDNHNTLLDRVSNNAHVHAQYRSMLRDKIFEALFGILQQDKIKPSLKEKVHKFVNLNPVSHTPNQILPPNINSRTPGSSKHSSPPNRKQSPRKQSARKVNNQVNGVSNDPQSSSPFMKLTKSTNPKEFKSELSNIESVSRVFKHSPHRSPRRDQVAHSIPINSRIRKGIGRRAQDVHISPQQPSDKNQVINLDDDLRRAYELVMAKGSPEISAMARRLLHTSYNQKANNVLDRYQTNSTSLSYIRRQQRNIRQQSIEPPRLRPSERQEYANGLAGQYKLRSEELPIRRRSREDVANLERSPYGRYGPNINTVSEFQLEDRVPAYKRYQAEERVRVNSYGLDQRMQRYASTSQPRRFRYLVD